MLKKIMKYIGLFLAIVVATVLIAGGALMISTLISPENPLTLFGYRYYKFSTENTEFLTTGYESYDIVDIKTNRTSIFVKSHTNSALTLEYNNNLQGYGKTSETEFGISSEVVNREIEGVVKKVLVIVVNEPEGLMINNNSKVVLGIPSSHYAKSFILETNTGETVIGNDDVENLKVNNIVHKTNKGDLTVMKVHNIHSLETESVLNNVTLNSNVATVVKFKTNLGKINFNTVGRFECVAKNASITGTRVTGDVSYEGESGVIEIETIDGNLASSGSVFVNCSTINNNVSYLSGSASKVSITKIVGNAVIVTESGEVIVGRIDGTANVTTTLGNVTINDAKSDVTITSKSGIVIINYSETTNSDTTLNYTSKNGKLTVAKIKGRVLANVLDGGTCKIDIAYAEMSGASTINAKRGSVNITAPINALVINVKTEANSNISYANISNTNKITGDLLADGATVDTTTKLTIESTSGDITISAVA